MKTYTYKVRIKITADNYAPFFLSGIVVGSDPKDATESALFTAKQWLVEKHPKVNANARFTSCENLKANDFFIDSEKVKKWKQQKPKK